MGKLSQEVQIVLGVVAAAVVLGLVVSGYNVDTVLKNSGKGMTSGAKFRLIASSGALSRVSLLIVGVCVVALLVMKR